MDLVNILYIDRKAFHMKAFLFDLILKIIIKKSDLYLLYKWLVVGYLMIFIEKTFIMN
jgi:hypothetical protein